jgi:hypothetical protein
MYAQVCTRPDLAFVAGMLGYSLSHHHSYFGWPTQGIAMPTL